MGPQIPNRSPDAQCARIAGLQFGVLARQQALQAGMTPMMIRHRLRTGRWDEDLPSIYRICGAPRSELQQVMAACLWGGEGAVAFGLCAAAAWELEEGSWRPPEIAVARQLKAARLGIVARRITTFGRRDLTSLGSLPVTSAVRTIIDIASRVDEATLEIALDQLLRRGRLTLTRLLARTDELGPTRVPGLGVVRELAKARRGSGAMTQSELETLTRRWLRTHGFPEPVFQYWITLPDYGPARLDCAYPDLKIAIEADSHKWHTDAGAFERDRARNSELASFGWIVFQTTKRELQRSPEAAANRLRRARDRRLGKRRHMLPPDSQTMG